MNPYLIGAAFVLGIPGAAASVLLYERNKLRIHTAVAVLRGHVEIPKEGFRCGREHPSATQTVIDSGELAQLERAARELVLAQGYIGKAEKVPYSESVRSVIDKKP